MNPILAQYIREHKEGQDKPENSETENKSEEVDETDSVNIDENKIAETKEVTNDKAPETDYEEIAEEQRVKWTNLSCKKRRMNAIWKRDERI
ncbi:MAG: hypothetical protein ACLT90_00770 [Enterococcus raffinosus]